MFQDFIHLESTQGNQSIVRLSFISCAKWEDEELLVFMVGDSDPLSVSGEQAKRLWTVLLSASQSLSRESLPDQPGVNFNP